MKKVYMILSPLLPCPDVQGGAIEKLVTNLAKENEKQNLIELNIVSKYNKEALEESKKYKNTNFIFTKTDMKYKILLLLYRIFKKLKIRIFPLNYYYYNAFRNIEKDTDYIIVEGGNYESYKEFQKYFGKEKMVLHIHQDLKSTEKLNEIFGKVIGVSQFCIRQYNADKDVDTVVLKNGIDLEKFDRELKDTEKFDIRNSFNIKKDDFVILFCGRLIQVKGVLELIKSIKEINDDKIKLLIIGSPNFGAEANSEYAEELKKEAEALKNQIIFTGYIPNEEIYQYCQIADIQAIPSLWEDAAPLTAIEGMASGLPIIATKSGGMVEYIDEKCAEIIEKDEKVVLHLKNAILELYQDKERREKMSIHGKERAKQYSMQKYYEDFAKIIQEWEKK